MISLNEIKAKVTNPDFLILVTWAIYLILRIYEGTILITEDNFVTNHLQVLRYGIYLIAVLSFLRYRIQLKDLIIYAILLTASAVIGYVSTDKSFMFLTFFIIVVSQIKMRDLLKVTFWVQLISFTLLVGLSLSGVIQDYQFDLLTRRRHALGFTWATLPQTMMLFLTLEYCILRSKKISYLEIIVIEIISFMIYRLSDARMPFLVGTLFLGAVCIVKIFDLNTPRAKWFQHLIAITPIIIIIAAISMYFLYNPNNAVWIKINNLLTGRMNLGSNAIERYGMTMFGQPLKLVGHSVENVMISQSNPMYNYIDCSYLQILMKYGVAGLIVTAIELTILAVKAVKSRNIIFLISFLLMLLLCVTEDSLIIVRFNVFLLFTFTALKREENDTPKKEETI